MLHGGVFCENENKNCECENMFCRLLANFAKWGKNDLMTTDVVTGGEID